MGEEQPLSDLAIRQARCRQLGDLWADGSCYRKVIPTLQGEGHEVVSTQNSLDTLEGDVAAVKRALGRVSSPAILVGHSYGGTVITAAGTDDRVAGLVYLRTRS
ncbi:MAG TPA: alpha/beta fold hydrolase [Solirubrobacteraceae bacterium]|nr:alpha/beta fold hydrolase [Solirubrobacteraceae bacterium]